MRFNLAMLAKACGVPTPIADEESPAQLPEEETLQLNEPFDESAEPMNTINSSIGSNCEIQPVTREIVVDKEPQQTLAKTAAKRKRGEIPSKKKNSASKVS